MSKEVVVEENDKELIKKAILKIQDGIGKNSISCEAVFSASKKILKQDVMCADVLPFNIWAYSAFGMPCVGGQFFSSNNRMEYILMKQLVADNDNHFYVLTKEECLDFVSKRFYQVLKDEFDLYLKRYIRDYKSCKETNFPENTDRMFNSFAERIATFETLHKNTSYKEEFVQYMLQNHVIKADVSHWDRNQREKYPVFFNRRLESFLSQIDCMHLLNGVGLDHSHIIFMNERGGYEVENEGEDVDEWRRRLRINMICPVAVGSGITLLNGDSHTVVLGVIVLMTVMFIVLTNYHYNRCAFGPVYDKYVKKDEGISFSMKVELSWQEDEKESLKTGSRILLDNLNDLCKEPEKPSDRGPVEKLLIEKTGWTNKEDMIKAGWVSKAVMEELNGINKAKKELAAMFDNKERYEIFVGVRCDQYLEPYLKYLNSKEGPLTPEEETRFKETFGKVRRILEEKKESIQHNKDVLREIEFSVTEKEIDSYLKANELEQVAVKRGVN